MRRLLDERGTNNLFKFVLEEWGTNNLLKFVLEKQTEQFEKHISLNLIKRAKNFTVFLQCSTLISPAS